MLVPAKTTLQQKNTCADCSKRKSQYQQKQTLLPAKNASRGEGASGSSIRGHCFHLPASGDAGCSFPVGWFQLRGVLVPTSLPQQAPVAAVAHHGDAAVPDLAARSSCPLLAAPKDERQERTSTSFPRRRGCVSHMYLSSTSWDPWRLRMP